MEQGRLEVLGVVVMESSTVSPLVVIFFLGSSPLFQFLVNFLLLIYMSMSTRRKKIYHNKVYLVG